VLVVLEGLESQQGELETVLAIARFGMTSPSVAAGFGQDGKYLVDHTHGPRHPICFCGRAGRFGCKARVPSRSQASQTQAGQIHSGNESDS